mmetsp:Transcript_1888/g.5147  ORF Transcript_1888/g.5147 Transcript_1888/m.5147 type:complete len:85 (-) Transcript_1888:245-499(-)
MVLILNTVLFKENFLIVVLFFLVDFMKEVLVHFLVLLVLFLLKFQMMVKLLLVLILVLMMKMELNILGMNKELEILQLIYNVLF